jgi:hypothetical protein
MKYPTSFNVAITRVMTHSHALKLSPVTLPKTKITLAVLLSIQFNLFHPWIIIHDMGQVKD